MTRQRDNRDGFQEAVGHDVTTSQQMAEALRQSEARYRTLFNSIDEGFCIIEVIFDAQNQPVDYCFLEINPSFEKQTGLQDAVGKRMRELAPQHEAHWFEMYGRIALTGEPVRFQNRAEQLRRWYDVYAFRIGEPAQRQVAILFNDITERKQTEAALQQAQRETDRERARLKFIFDSAPVGISFTLTEADGRRTNLINDAHLRLCGLTRKQAAEPGSFTKITVAEDQQRQQVFTRQIESGEIDRYAMDKRYRQPDGQIVWVLFSFQRRHYPDGSYEDLSIVVDITERKQAEEALRRSEESLAVTLQSIGDAVLATDPAGRVTRMNPVAEKLTGWTQAEAQGRPIGEVFRIINEVTRAPAEIPVAKVLATGLVQGLANHTVVIARDGTERPIADSAAPIHDKAGNTLGVVLVFRDVTEEKQAERAIHESEERLRAMNERLEQRVKERTAVLNRQSEIISSANDAMIICGYADDCIKFWNQGAARLYGWTREEVIGKNIHALLHAKFPRPLAEIKAGFLAEGYWQGELTHTRRDGRQIMVMSSWNLQRDESGAPVSRLAIYTDITERKRAEAALEESERFARATLDALTAHVAILDAAGVIVATNKTWQEFAGQNGLPLAQAGPGVNYLAACTGVADKMAAGIREVIAGQKKEFTLEYDCHSPTEKRWFHCRVTPFPGNGPVRVVVAHENITQMKLLERQQIRHSRMESLGTLAGGVAHDLNNALAPILMGVGILREKYPRDTEVVDMFQTSALRSAGMVRQLLTFAKGAEGARVAIQLPRLVEEMRGIIHGTFPKNIRLEVRCEKNLPTILGDVTQLHQVLLNLCVNARDAMPEGGTLSLTAEARELDAIYASSVPEAKPGQYIVLRVHDTGTGIPPEIIERIFEPFFTTKNPDKGTGLGLSNVMGIIKGHGGFVQVYSQPRQGSTFAVYLPASRRDSDTEHLLRPGAIFHGQGQTILLVEDDAAVREVGCAVLQRLNFNPLPATDGADGLMKAVEHRDTLTAVITDLHMPHMDGLAFVRALLRILPDIPVVVTSGRLEDMAREEFEALGVTRQLDKPFTEAQLATLLKSIFAPP
jgi:PAS domain S-box-containing protein